MAREHEPSAESTPAGSTDGGHATRVAELEGRYAELEARWLRAQADYQNVRRRAQQDLESALLRTLQPLLDELLLVADYLDMALASPAASDDARTLAQGVALTRSKLVQALEQIDVRPVPTSGPFDPALHEAAGSRPAGDRPPGSILETLRPGYTWQGRILRPARVVVAAAPEGQAAGR